MLGILKKFFVIDLELFKILLVWVIEDSFKVFLLFLVKVFVYCLFLIKLYWIFLFFVI